MEELFEQLLEYGESGRIPMHMPGHKRECGIFEVLEPHRIDITEIEGFDDYHHPQGILRESMDRAARIYGTRKTYYLVNGSTAGILAAISAATVRGDKILLARNCHKAVGHAVELRGLEPVYVYPQPVENLWISGAILPQDVEKKLTEHPEAKAVVVTSPTYEGVISDIAEIARIVHEHQKILIVDEAHGAHLPFGEDFPKSAVCCGADVVIQSLHKTLPCYTQTAVLHLCSERVSAERVQKYLGIYQTSSPSYVFMAAMERCIAYMYTEGRQRMRAYFSELKRLRERLKNTAGIRLLEQDKTMYDYEPSKIVLSGEHGQTGVQIARVFREDFQIEPEMTADDYVILMTSFCDKQEWHNRIMQAAAAVGAKSLGNVAFGSLSGRAAGNFRATVRMTPAMAAEAEAKEILLEEAVGSVCAQEVYVYPPGIPILMPGEEITRECLEIIEGHKAAGLSVKGLAGQKGEGIRCIK